MKSFSIQFYRHFYRVMAAVSVLCLACSACTRTGETATLKNINRFHTIPTYSPDINDYPELVQRLSTETREFLDVACEMEFSTKDELNDAIFRQVDGEVITPPYLCRLDYKMTANTPKVVAVQGDWYSFDGGFHGQYDYRTHIWLPQARQWLTVHKLLENPHGFEAVRDVVRAQLHEQGLNDNWIRDGTAQTEDMALFLPLMADNGQIAGLRFIFPPYQVASFADGTREVDISASVLYPYVGAEYRDLLVQP